MAKLVYIVLCDSGPRWYIMMCLTLSCDFIGMLTVGHEGFSLDFTSFVIQRIENSYRCWTTVIIITVLLRNMVQQTSRGEWAAVDSSREICWTVSRNYTVFLYPVMSKLQNQISIHLLFWHQLTRPTQNFRNSKCTECDHRNTALWRHSGGAWREGLFLTTDSNVICWADVANHVNHLYASGWYGKFWTLDHRLAMGLITSLTDWLLIRGSYSKV